MVDDVEVEETGLTPAICLAEAGNILIQAAEFATETKDTETLISIAQGWVALSDRLVPSEEEDDKETTTAIGFNSSPGDKEKVSDAKSAKRVDKSRLYAQHGKL